jgi:diguanylate cyclase (GGDEF)-like protein
MLVPPGRASGPSGPFIEEDGVPGHEGLPTLVRAFAEQTGADSALLAVWRPGDDRALTVAGWGLPSGLDELEVGPSHPGLQALLDRPLGLSTLDAFDLPLAAANSAGGGRAHVLSIPLASSEQPLAGVLCAGFSAAPVRPVHELIWLAEAYAGTVALCFSGSPLLGALVEAARRDWLTGALNYAGLLTALELEVNRSERHGHELACLFLDLDGFKEVNDEHGHGAGNDVLIAVARALDQSVRGCDIVARYGGDEFVIAAPETEPGLARLLARRLRGEIGRATEKIISHPVTASIGIASWKHGLGADELLALADESLIAAKAGHLPIGALLPAPGQAAAAQEAGTEPGP